MIKKPKGLLFKFGVVFSIFIIITLTFTGISTYRHQDTLYREECEISVQKLASHLEEQMQRSKTEYAAYQKIMLSHYDDIDIPMDMDNYMPEKNAFYTAFEKQYPGKVPGVDVEYDKMTEELQLAFAKYQHEYWLLLFEEVRESFSTSYTYYVVPTGQKWHMHYMIDAVREGRENDPNTMHLCIDAVQSPDDYPRMWQAIETGEKPDGNDSIDNEFGKTYAYFNPLVLDGEIMGVIAVELNIADVNHVILKNTLQQMLKIAVILIFTTAIMLYYINRYYISKLSNLRRSVGDYSKQKDPSIASSIEQISDSGDEISALSMQVAAMITELDSYMRNLVETTNELSHTKERAAAMNELAHKDALTSVRNKTAYDAEIKHLNWQVEDGFTDFAIGMVDLNYLKRINDTYGHEHGNDAIRNICQVICAVFSHSAVFRIGGDEFVIILKNQDYTNMDALVEQFNTTLADLAANPRLKPWEAVSAAIGVARFDPAIDSDVNNVFKRADKIMYAHKEEMKARRT